MEERLTVFVNDKPVTVFQGMTVKHALIAFDYTLYRDVRDGKAVVKMKTASPSASAVPFMKERGSIST